MPTRGTYLMVERLVIIQNSIRDDYYPNSTTLQKKVKAELGIEFSIPTLSRDIDFLRNRMNCPIEYDIHQKGYYWNHAA